MDLIDRLQKAERPDRALDWEIHCRDGLEGVGAYGDHPSYTASIDAAVTLVPDGHGWHVSGDGTARVWNADRAFYGLHANKDINRKPPIALCIAALRARG